MHNNGKKNVIAFQPCIALSQRTMGLYLLLFLLGTALVHFGHACYFSIKRTRPR